MTLESNLSSRFTLLFLSAFTTLAACGDGSEATPGAPLQPDEPSVPTCEIALVDDSAAALTAADIASGRSLVLGIVGDADAELVVEATDGLEVEQAGDALTVRDRGLSGPGVVSVTAHCEGAVATAEVAVNPRSPRFEALASWRPGDQGPIGREYFSMWVDPTDVDRMWLFGGFVYEPQQFTPSNALWSYDLEGESWTSVEPAGELPALPGGGLAFGDVPTSALYYGGMGRDDLGFFIPYSMVELGFGDDETVTVTEHPAPAGVAGGAYQPAFFFHPPSGRYLAIGGTTATGALSMAVTAYDPQARSWSDVEVTGLGLPTGRTGFFWAYDEATDRFVVFSGDQGGQGPECACASDTWALELGAEPPRWVALDVDDGAPAGRRNGAFALDPEGHRLIILGGTSDGRTAQPGVYALSLDRDAERWAELDVDTTDGAPTARSSGAMVYDSVRDRMLVGFGNDAITGAFTDLWAISF